MSDVQSYANARDGSRMVATITDDGVSIVRYHADGSPNGDVVEIETLDRWNRQAPEREHDGWQSQS